MALQGHKVGHGKTLQDSHFKIDPKVGLDGTAEVHVATEEQAICGSASVSLSRAPGWKRVRSQFRLGFGSGLARHPLSHTGHQHVPCQPPRARHWHSYVPSPRETVTVQPNERELRERLGEDRASREVFLEEEALSIPASSGKATLVRTDPENQSRCTCPHKCVLRSSDLGLEAGLSLQQVSVIYGKQLHVEA